MKARALSSVQYPSEKFGTVENGVLLNMPVESVIRER